MFWRETGERVHTPPLTMEVERLPISLPQKKSLVKAGYTTLVSLLSVSPSRLARDLNISEAEASEILRLASESPVSNSLSGNPTVSNVLSCSQSAWDMLHEEVVFGRITTSCAELDEILGGGISCKQVTEIGGVPGIGKTQLGIQLAVNVQMPVDYGGLKGKAVYIDTEGSFMVERTLQIVEGCKEDMSASCSTETDFQDFLEKWQPKNFLRNIFYFRVCSYQEQIELINNLETFISAHKDVKIVIVDSIAFHFRQEFEDLSTRTRILSGMASNLTKLAKNSKLAVVLLNQVTAKHKEGSFHLTLALGDTWSRPCTNRVILYWNGNERYAYIDKSPTLQSASAPFSVTSKGIRSSISHCKRIKRM
ncbi:hypothetical protein QQ045_009209 [Rhodiola kirilowii]